MTPVGVQLRAIRRRTAKLCGAWLLCMVWAAGCGGGSRDAAPPPSAPEAPAEATSGYAAPESAKEAEGLEGDEYSQPPHQPSPAATATGTADGALSRLFPQGDASVEQWEAWLDSRAEALSASYGCPDACRALDSLERAQTHICKLLGPGDPGDRCKRAKDRVAAAKIRVETQCKCQAP